MPRHIMVVEDEPALRENYAAVLRRQGYDVSSYGDRAAATDRCRSRLPDLVILDIGLGEEVEGGFDMCRELRAQSATLPIIFLTARDSDFDTISGLRLGADDYLTKDISIPHILARIAALFRRTDALKNNSHAAEQLISHGALAVNADRLTIHWHDQPVPLTLTEFWMVHALARRPGHVKNRDQLMKDANVYVDDTTVTSHIKRIRKKFREVDPEFDHIETVYGMGYRWRSQ
jgi:two-component system OmpR family response regulator